jgi:hypothetical protein
LLSVAAQDKFLENIVLSDEGCWEWQGGKSHGYGGIAIKQASGYLRLWAHRVAYELLLGTIPAGMEICHHCDNPSCVRPSHLFLGTHADNMRDAFNKGILDNGIAALAGCARDSKGELNPAARLTKEDVREIRVEASKGVFHRKLAERYGITRVQVTNIVNRKRWAHVE